MPKSAKSPGQYCDAWSDLSMTCVTRSPI